MKIYDIVAMALRNLFKRKVRTFLTVLAVMIGAASIIVMFSLGLGLNRTMKQRAEMMGDITLIEVYNGNYIYSGMGVAFNDALIEEVKALPEVEIVSPFMNIYGEIVSGRYTYRGSFSAMTPEMMASKNLKLETGRMFTGDEKNVVIFSKEAQYGFMTERERKKLESSQGNMMMYGGYEPQDYSDRELNIDVFKDRMQFVTPENEEAGKKKERPIEIQAVGILEEGNYNYEQFQNYIDLDTALEINKRQNTASVTEGGRRQKDKGYEQVYIKCNSMDEVKPVVDFLEGKGLTNIWTSGEWITESQNTLKSLQGFLAFMGIIFLFVAAIMVANTMIMSIYERTREIGVMKVIGASIKDIRNLFLTEAAIIGFFGGIVGVIVSLIITAVVNKVGLPFLDMFSMEEGLELAIVPPWLAVGGLLFSALIGLVSGILPARQAMRLEAIDAIEAE